MDPSRKRKDLEGSWSQKSQVALIPLGYDLVSWPCVCVNCKGVCNQSRMRRACPFGEQRAIFPTLVLPALLRLGGSIWINLRANFIHSSFASFFCVKKSYRDTAVWERDASATQRRDEETGESRVLVSREATHL